ncbi:MAG: S-layer homology domain-containing protein, partial [Clostridiales bacterium]
RTAIIDDFLKQGYYIIIPFLASEQSRSHYVAVDRVEDGVAYMFDPGFSATVLYEKFSTEDDLARNTYLIPYKPVNILAHQHDYYETYEENHPHKIMMKCKTCSNFYYTGKNKVLTDCRQCKIDNCQHQYLKGHDDAHPHKVFMKCSKCQSLTYTNELFQDKNCPICQKEIAKAEAAKIRFDDLQKYPWAEEAIYDLTRQCVIKGLDKDSFGPDKNIKRADYLCMLMRMLDAEAEIKNNFSDVGKDKYYYHEIGVAKALGLTDGRGNNLFMPEQFLSRQDMFVMAARILEKYQVIGKIDKADIAVLKQFTDQSSIADYAKKPIAALVSKKLVKGLNGEIDPLTNANRAQTAVFVDRLKGLLVK